VRAGKYSPPTFIIDSGDEIRSLPCRDQGDGGRWPDFVPGFEILCCIPKGRRALLRIPVKFDPPGNSIVAFLYRGRQCGFNTKHQSTKAPDYWKGEVFAYVGSIKNS